MATQPVTAEQAVLELPGLQWPQRDFIAKTPFGDFTANIVEEGVEWTWVGLKDEPKLVFLHKDCFTINPDSLDWALWELEPAHQEFVTQILAMSEALNTAFPRSEG